MKINEVEAAVGVTKKNIRFYEEEGLISPRREPGNGYRSYSAADVERLRRIKLLRKLDVPLAEIRQMLEGECTLADGMNVRVAVRQKVPGQLVVPKSAVVIRDNLEVLFRYKDGRAQWTYVHTSLANSREYVVEANLDRGAELNPGDLVIVSGNLNLADGSEVSLGREQ